MSREELDECTLAPDCPASVHMRACEATKSDVELERHPRPLSELRETGLLWLINRQVFHPRGFAIGLSFDDAGEVDGWELYGDGIEPWNFKDGEENDYLAAVNRTLRPHEGEATS